MIDQRYSQTIDRLFQMYALSTPIHGLQAPVDHGGADWTPANGSEIEGVHTNVNNFIITTGYNVYVKAYDGTNYGRLEVHASNATISGNLIATGKGYANNSGPGAGASRLSCGIGAGDGGRGGVTSCGGGAGGVTYGTYDIPNDIGSGGGTAPGYGIGGYGGGLIKLIIDNITNATGTIRADGGNTSWWYGGGGSGGTIYIDSSGISGTGTISANGGGGSTRSGYGCGGDGGGGRIALYYSSKTFIGTISVNSGTGGCGGALAGTIFEQPTCTTATKYSGDFVTLKATPKAGIGPYNVTFRKNSVDIPGAYYTGQPENVQITYNYQLTDEDIRNALTGTIDLSVFISDSCPTGAKTCENTCTVTIGCVSPTCHFVAI